MPKGLLALLGGGDEDGKKSIARDIRKALEAKDDEALAEALGEFCDEHESSKDEEADDSEKEPDGGDEDDSEY